MTVQFTINGEEFLALNGGPQFAFTPAISLVVRCDTRKRSTISGRSSRRAAKRWPAAG